MKQISNHDEQMLNSFRIRDNTNLNDYALTQLSPNSLFIKNGVTYIVGGISSGKSTLMSKLAALYTKTINPIIISFYGGLAPDETSTFNLSSFNIHPMFIKLPTPESMVSFFMQYRYKRTKLAELLMFLMSVYKDNAELLLSSIGTVEELGLNDSEIRELDSNQNKRFRVLLSYITNLITTNKLNVDSNAGFIYLSDFILKQYSKRHNINLLVAPEVFIARCLISICKGFHEVTITVDVLNDPGIKTKKFDPNRFHPYTFKSFLRVTNVKNIAKGTKKSNSKPNGLKIELIPSIMLFDDVAQFPLLTTERSGQFVKDIMAETRRYQNTFIIASQRYNLLNKTLRSLVHTFCFGYGLVDNDIPIMAKEFPSNLLESKEFITMYKQLIKPFSFIVYNSKYGVNFIQLRK